MSETVFDGITNFKTVPQNIWPNIETPEKKQRNKAIRVKPIVYSDYVSVKSSSDGPGVNEDKAVKIMNFQGFDVMRLATIGDGNCLLHSFLKSVYSPYQNSKSHKEKLQMGYELRKILLKKTKKGLADKLGITEIIPEEDLKKLFKSMDFLGQETLVLLSNIFRVTIFIFSYDKNRFIGNAHIKPKRKSKLSIAFAFLNNHYEPIVIKEDGYISSYVSENCIFSELHEHLGGHET